MRNLIQNLRLSELLGAILCVILVTSFLSSSSAAEAEKTNARDSGPKPVDGSMHHFMEYVFEPNYKRLRAGMSHQAKDKAAWKAIKGDALTLAECANLLLLRAPEKDADQWRKLSIAVRTHGGELYQAARKSDKTTADAAYRKMLNNCNACHKRFADGKHQLKP